MKENKSQPSDESLGFLNKFVELFEDIIEHDGYGDINVSVRLLDTHTRLVSMRYGKEFQFRVQRPRLQASVKRNRRFAVSRIKPTTRPVRYLGPNRRLKAERRKQDRRQNREPRNFRLERRMGSDRRRPGDRRKDE